MKAAKYPVASGVCRPSEMACAASCNFQSADMNSSLFICYMKA